MPVEPTNHALVREIQSYLEPEPEPPVGEPGHALILREFVASVKDLDLSWELRVDDLGYEIVISVAGAGNIYTEHVTGPYEVDLAAYRAVRRVRKILKVCRGRIAKEPE